MDVNALLELRANVDRTLAERSRDLQRQLTLLRGEGGRRGRPKVPPQYRGPEGETWAGRGAKPRWLTALLKEGRSIEEFSIGAGRKQRAAAAKKSTTKMKGRKPAVKARRREQSAESKQPSASE
jgi:DNA-binding protein H-NS